MKKKVLMAIMPVCVAMAMTACGGNTDTKEAEETAVTEEREEDVEAEPTVESTVGNETEAVTETNEITEEPAEEESTEPEYSFMEVTGVAVTQDKTADYGINSTSCEDIWQFLDDNNEIAWVYDYESKEQNEYSGRFAYPTLVQSDAVPNAIITQRTDAVQYVSAWVGDGEESYSIEFTGGYGSYNMHVQQAEYYAESNITDAASKYSFPFTVDTEEGTQDVICWRMDFPSFDGYDGSVNINEDGEYVNKDEEVIEPIELKSIWSYLYKLGGFTVSIHPKEEIPQEKMQSIVDSIVLVGGEKVETVVTDRDTVTDE